MYFWLQLHEICTKIYVANVFFILVMFFKVCNVFLYFDIFFWGGGVFLHLCHRWFLWVGACPQREQQGPWRRTIRLRTSKCIQSRLFVRGLCFLVLALRGGAEVVKEVVKIFERRSFLGIVFPALRHDAIQFLWTLDRTASRLGQASAVAYEHQCLCVVFA